MVKYNNIIIKFNISEIYKNKNLKKEMIINLELRVTKKLIT
jgi:hypothetical protein